jgi:two-component sensor histidine kinase
VKQQTGERSGSHHGRWIGTAIGGAYAALATVAVGLRVPNGSFESLAEGLPLLVGFAVLAAMGELNFTVKDDGEGFDPGAAPRGAGLQFMADLPEALGGTLEVESAPGEGTTVTGLIPVGPGGSR